MAGRSGSRSRKDQEARRAALLRALTYQTSVSAASRTTGIPLRTCWRYIQAPDFQADLEAARSAALEAVVDDLRKAGREAVAALREGLQDEDTRVRVTAADKILRHLLQGVEARRLEQALVDLELREQEPATQGQA